jgi:hypothetical protein
VDVTSTGGADRCSMQSNSNVLNQALRGSAEISSLLGDIHPEKRGSPGKHFFAFFAMVYRVLISI